MLPDRDTGSLVEVDVVIEDQIAGHSIIVAVECTSAKRKATIEWYREMRGKHSSLPINKTVLVSQSGFTREVQKKARVENVELLTLQQAEQFNWHSLFHKLKGGTIADVGFHLRSLSLLASADSEADLGGFDADTVIKFLDQQMPLGQLVMQVAVQQGLTRQIMTNLGEIIKKTDHCNFRFKLPDGSSVVIGEKQVEVSEIEASLWIRPRFQSVDWRSVKINDQTLATGTFPAEFLFPGTRDDTVVIASGENNDFRVSLLAPTDEDVQLDVFPHALWPSKNQR